MQTKKKCQTVDEYWRKVILVCDKSQIVPCLYLAKRDEKYNPNPICPRSERKISLMFWGCICFDGVRALTAVEGNINSAKHIDILEENLWPVLVWYVEDKEYLFMGDNAPVHAVQNYNMNTNEITSLEWPAQFRDLNSTENIWLYIKRKLQKSMAKIATKNDLFRAIQNMWKEIELDYRTEALSPSLINWTMSKKMKGRLTKY